VLVPIFDLEWEKGAHRARVAEMAEKMRKRSRKRKSKITEFQKRQSPE
jgi:hypothetical protein